jgi:hypothetical protein
LIFGSFPVLSLAELVPSTRGESLDSWPTSVQSLAGSIAFQVWLG